jgi:NAD(P)-dependent dehydrogenase (short-subunit alcohol dehydrogenase family)
MPDTFSGKTVLVTGGGGIGAATCRAVAVIDRDGVATGKIG